MDEKMMKDPTPFRCSDVSAWQLSKNRWPAESSKVLHTMEDKSKAQSQIHG